jgi:hypothetical protein
MRGLVRAVLLLVVLIVAGVVAFGWWTGSTWRLRSADRPVATTGTIDTTKARERGAEIGEQTARAAARIEETVAEAAISSKIKAKMALDDAVRARSIDVHTNGSTVTLTGTVRSTQEHDRAVRLARETAGVGDVVDQLRVE